MNKIELLAPAGSMESLTAAVQAGADAVYLGGSKFSARAYASNFDEEGMERAVDYCHLYGVKVYVTMNTLLKDSEIKEAVEYAGFLYEIGVDALIIQDTGLAQLLGRIIPDMELHASTQMTVHNAEGAKLLTNMGFKRIVLSRELSLDEISYVSKDMNIETEVFIHGALCVCYSGQCLMSSLIGGRSGNRGRCAQPCRLPYELENLQDGKSEKGYLLSPKDICTIEDVKDIIESGTSSLKIEGRMKRPEYVAGVVSAYRRAIDHAYAELNHKDDETAFDVEEQKKRLMQLFNREGFSKSYMFGNVGRDMMAYSFPKNTGVRLGTVDKSMNVMLSESIGLKDGVRIGDTGFTVSKIMLKGKEVTEAGKGDMVKLKPSSYRPGDVLFKTSDTQLLKELEGCHKNEFGRKIPLAMKVSFMVGKPLRLEASFNGVDFSVEGDVVQEALKKPIEEEKLVSQLKKSGDTPLEFSQVEIESFEQGFMPVSSMNSARRKLVEDVERHIVQSAKRKLHKDVSQLFDKMDGENAIHKEKRRPDVHVLVSNEEQLKAALECGVKNLIVEPYVRKCNLKIEDLVEIQDVHIYVKVPNVLKTEMKQVMKSLRSYRGKIAGIVTGNLGVMEMLRDEFSIIGDYKLNMFNRFSMGFYGGLLKEATLSVELNKAEMAEVCKTSSVKSCVMIYGKLENMVSEYCPIGSTFGGKRQGKQCSGACERGEYVLRDRMKEEFLVRCDKFCRARIYNNVPLNLIGNLNEIEKMKVDSVRLDFIDEGYEDVVKVLDSLKSGKWEGDFGKFTRGHYKRGVE